MKVLTMILVCSVFTMIPRIIPYFMPFLAKLPRKIKKCMMLLPVASLGALIFPLALTDFKADWYAGLIGVTAAFITSYFKGSMFLSIIISLLATVGMLYLI